MSNLEEFEKILTSITESPIPIPHETLQNIYLGCMAKYVAQMADSLDEIIPPRKAEKMTMLEELKKEIEELKSYESADGQDLVMLADIGILFQKKIDKLKEE